MHYSRPAGHIQAEGSFGPIPANSLGATPASGNFTFAAADLAEIGDISGVLSARGHFYGSLAAIEADITSDTPDFAVHHGRPTNVAASAHATINGLNANIVLHTVEARTGSTIVHAQGKIVGSPKATDLDLTVVGGRAEDLLRPFLHDEPPVTGKVWLKSHAHVAPAGNGLKFLQRLHMDGSFDLPAQRITDRTTEQELSAFSGRAQGDQPATNGAPKNSSPTASADVLSSLEGRVTISNGVVSTDRLDFQVPGAAIDLNGTYNLQNRNVYLLGNLHMQSDISHITTGFKSLLLKPLIPFFRKDNAGAVIPIAITGGPGQYKITQNLLHHK
jgi:AsmA-like C-terminal region